MNFEVFVIDKPELSEIEEMLECVSLDHDLDKVLPMDCNRVSKMQRGWCFLWYDAKTLNPLGYTYFEFFDKKGRKPPYFHFCGTRFLESKHYRFIRNSILRVFRQILKNKVRAYIPYENVLASRLAESVGFEVREITDKGILWDLAAGQNR